LDVPLGLANASNAVREAIVAVEQAGPHGRDFQSEDALNLAQQQQRERVEALKLIRDELIELALSVLHQT